MDQAISRRAFAALLAAAAGELKGADAQPRAKFPKEPRRRLSVSTYPFRSVIQAPDRAGSAQQPEAAGKPKMTLPEFAATIVNDFGVYGIEPWSHHFESIEPAYINRLHAAFEKAQVKVVNIPCDVRVHLCGSEGERNESVETYKRWVDAAQALGSPSIRVHVPKPDKPGDYSCAIEGLKRVAEYGAQKGMVLNLENDSPSTEAPDVVLKVIEGVNSPFLRSLPDFCNSMQIQNDENFNAHALEQLFAHAYNISHVKDLEIVNGRRLQVNVDRIFAIAKKANYRGYFSMETEGSEDPYMGTKRLIEASLRNLS